MFRSPLCFVDGHRAGFRPYRAGIRLRHPSTLEWAICVGWNTLWCWLHGHDFVLIGIPEPMREIQCPHCGAVLGTRW